MHARPRRIALFLALGVALLGGPLAVVAALRLGHDPVAAEGAAPLIHRLDDFVGSTTCGSCHPDQHASWERTFHRSMTQRPTDATVLGAFDGRTVELFGGSARVFRDGERFCFDLPDGGARRMAVVALAVGSRRYQQYFEAIERPGGEAFRRLPLVWHVAAGRWMHLNGVFLEPDDDDWSRHASVWNENCIFCHNTGARPGIVDLAARADASRRAFDSKVGELGIACEACHGPGAAHAAAQRSPLARYAAHAAGDAPDIVDPQRLDHERSSALCGQCHGQRLPEPRERITAWLTSGPTFRPGNRLLDHVAPLTPETPSPRADEPDLFRARFWGDGTARLSAYELQGVTESPCYVRGALACGSCHTMHGGDPHGMVEPRMRGDDACVQCHAAIGADVARHTGHAADSAGSRCLDCHMPRMVYGILGIHRSHRIEVPDPARDGTNARPHACTLCHVDKDLAWSAAAMNQIWGQGTTKYHAPAQRGDGAPLELPDAVASLLVGDPVQRAVYADAFGRFAGVAPLEHAAVPRIVLIATLFDAYPAIRWLALQSLTRLEADAPESIRALLARVRHDGPRVDREALGRELFDALAASAAARFRPGGPAFVGADYRPVMEVLVPLLQQQSRRAISIGE